MQGTEDRCALHTPRCLFGRWDEPLYMMPAILCLGMACMGFNSTVARRAWTTPPAYSHKSSPGARFGCWKLGGGWWCRLGGDSWESVRSAVQGREGLRGENTEVPGGRAMPHPMERDRRPAAGLRCRAHGPTPVRPTHCHFAAQLSSQALMPQRKYHYIPLGNGSHT